MTGASDVLGAGVAGALASLLLAPLLRRVALRFGALDRPGAYKAHSAPVPLLGGVAVGAATLLPLLWLLPDGAVDRAGLFAVAIGGVVVLLAGLLDDIGTLTPHQKVAWQVAATALAGLLLALLGVRLALFLHWPPAPIIVLTVVWIVGITNAVNLFDNMNGLCAGTGAIAAAALALTNFRTGELGVAVAAAALAGACLGFLPWNWPRARIFLGDAGSMFVGFMLAALSVLGVYTRGADLPELAVFVPLFVLALPLLDAILVTLLRLREGHPPWLGDRRHISHRLVRRGMRPATAVMTLWAASAACGLAALLTPTVGPGEAPLLLVLLACALAALAGAAGTRGLAEGQSSSSE